MSSSTSRSQSLPFATDEECDQLRIRLIRAGKIVPAHRVPAKTPARAASPDASPEPRPKRRNASEIPEEGTYRVRRITSDEEYERRKRNYFTMLQSILRARVELGLEFGHDDETGEGDAEA